MNKKLLLILASGFLLCSPGPAQVNWLHSFDLAKSIATSSSRLILIDFWTSWCGPCKVMDIELWQNSEMQKLSKNFVGVRINVDSDKALVARFGVTSIPKVVIVTVNGDIIWEQSGYDRTADYLQVFNDLPGDLGSLNSRLQAIASDRNDPQANYESGLEFQRLGSINKNNLLRDSFLNHSELCLKRALKYCDDPVMSQEIMLRAAMNDVHAGRFEKAIKNVLKNDSGVADENLAEYKHFVLAKCYSGINDKENYLKEIQMIVSKELLDQLEK